MNFGALPERLAHVRTEIARRQAAAGRTHPVTIVAVTKGFGLDAVAAARAAGLTDLGENRVQEALEKIDAPAGRGATWHLIGHLQRNKAKHWLGVSADYGIAVAEGATGIRLGTVRFGPRATGADPEAREVERATGDERGRGRGRGA